MPTEVRLASQKWRSRLNNGDDFSLNTSDQGNNLNAVIDETVRTVINIQIGSWTELKNWRILYTNAANDAIIRLPGYDFTQEFRVGDEYRMSFGGVQQCSGIVLSVKVGEIVVNKSIIFGLDAFPAENDNSTPDYGTDDPDFLSNTSDLLGLNYKFGLIENDDDTDFISKITNSELLYFCKNIPTTLAQPVVVGTRVGTNKAGYTGGLTVEFKGNVDDVNLTRGKTWKEFEIIHILDIVPLYRDGELDALKGLVAPPEDFFESPKSLKYVFEVGFLTDPFNIDTVKTAIFDTSKGNVKYINEPINNSDLRYAVENLVYTDITDSVTTDKLNIGHVVRVNYDITDTDEDISINQPFVLCVTALLNGQQSIYSLDDYQANWSKESIRVLGDGPTVNGDIIKNATIIVDGANVFASVQYDIDYPALAQARLSKGQDYFMSAIVQEKNTTIADSNKVRIPVDVNIYDKSTDIPDLFDVVRLEHNPHPKDFVDFATTTGFTNGVFNVQEGVLTIASMWLDVSKVAVMDTLNLKFTAKSTVDNTEFELRDTIIDISSSTFVGDTQQIGLDSTRGYILADGNQFNFVKMATVAPIGNLQYYELQVAWRVPWESWVALKAAARAIAANNFFDNTKEHDGLNNFAANYFSVAESFALKVLIVANVKQGDIVTEYIKESEDFHIYGYDEDSSGTPTYECVIQTFDESGIPLEGNILQKEPTTLRATLTPATPPVFSSTVDFTEVEADWTRYAHGNKFSLPFEREGVWENEQANDDDDTFFDGTTTFTKDSVVYASTTNEITTTSNAHAVYGLFSLIKYEFYTITGKMFSTATDNDVLIYNIAFFTDILGVQHTLSLVASMGGWGLPLNPLFSVGDDTENSLIFNSPAENATFGLVYDYGKRGCKVIDEYITTKSTFNWSATTDLDFEIIRVGNDITVDVKTWVIDSVNFGSTDTGGAAAIFEHNLNDDPDTVKFNGPQFIGFSFFSQNLGGFKEVVITIAADDYYATLAIDQEGAPTDFSQSVGSTIRGASIDSLIKNVTIDWVDPSFIISGDVDTDLVDLDQKFDYTAHIGERDRGV